ncbi:acyl-coenzyme A thioesterase THEM4-like [Protopterus annectens]|uniref:acyl-coenzyme A thioesterase THEM4-like n=1 Tax=Protopterus annectens TaxID=7888 RepID=UPI001CFAD908|nr:acyl-coenzyme A thioesterase THEM4-like [Protopterus annectens]XP_043935864.1 acyl-coenzyme A thioesterase THEM4-like [Protopterus annectens]XP_043935865.1 acyl-coenzyme A thioesterase THEM4-like [Protopterus annectens]XP_043935866.1 acyl-coenzyme A thioesterase THEM4-like [Protopterus annectens]
MSRLRHYFKVAGCFQNCVTNWSRLKNVQHITERWTSCKFFQVSSVPFSHISPPKDYGLPNPSWSKDMVNLFNKYMEKAKDGTWKKLPSYNRTIKFVRGMDTDSKCRLFSRNTDIEGAGFEYAMFYNKVENKLFSIFQFGYLLEGFPGHVHGGAIATAIDATAGSCASCFMGRVMTAYLNLNFRNPTPLGSTVVVDNNVEKIEGRKVFLTSQVRSIDGTKIYVDATALFIQLTTEQLSEMEKELDSYI